MIRGRGISETWRVTGTRCEARYPFKDFQGMDFLSKFLAANLEKFDYNYYG
jgi:hypothetical protein